MNVLSLFSGIGGLELGLERAGMTVVGQVEIDPFCQQVLAKHWPEVPRHDDVRTAVEWWRSEPRPRVDLVCGGFPCQDISVAGKRVGITGERSGLWSAMASTISALRPRYVLVENVPALLARGLDVVLADLAASGYDADWDCIPAAAVGAPHRRDRVFIVAHAQREQLRQQPVAVSGSGGAALAGDDGTAQPLADATSNGWRQGWTWRPAGNGQDGQGFPSQELAHAYSKPAFGTPVTRPQRHPWSAEPDVGRVAHGVPARVDRIRALGNAVVPQVAQFIGEQLMAHIEAEVAHG